ncbi:uncharacterized protein DUF3883 [Hoeflea marina]|uniref:Uncharacterized protein DUF3883 n=1 Tax=Hoeflea marina TaxID=274592 RepID=A0A317PQM9_9HYPH|nr:DUF3883 domain-containing protein [Hoeflea marina]PWW03798.1 uncharacterized protein DUF3883 [Hoeflea marina]
MAYDSKAGSDWTDDELDVIVADYFSMLGQELARHPYVKSHHNAAVAGAIGRSRGSIEFKYQNISAVLHELGLPWIFGYKPAVNFQNALFDAIDRHLTGNRDEAYRQAPTRVLHVAEPQSVFVPMPQAEDPPSKRSAGLERLVRKFDPVERDFRNRELGKGGEQFVLDIERQRLIDQDRSDLARKIRWVSMEDGDGAGYDILSFEPTGTEMLIEVKTANGAAKTPFFLTRTEVEVAEERKDAWQLYRVHRFAQTPQIFTVNPPLAAALRLDPESWRAAIR